MVYHRTELFTVPECQRGNYRALSANGKSKRAVGIVFFFSISGQQYMFALVNVDNTGGAGAVDRPCREALTAM